MPLFVKDVQEGLESIVRTGISQANDDVKKWFTELGPLVNADRQRKGILGFPELNEVSEETRTVFKKIKKYCQDRYDL